MSAPNASGTTAIQVSPTAPRFAELAAMFAEAEQNARALAEAQQRIRDLEYDLANLSRERDDANAANADLSTRLAEVARERDTFRTQYFDADAALHTARGDYDASQALLGESQAEVARLREALASRAKRIEELEAEVGSLQSRIVSLEHKLSDIRYHTKEIASLADTEWTNPDKPLSVPVTPAEVPATDPLSRGEALDQAGETVPFPVTDERAASSPSADPTAPQQEGGGDGTALGIADHQRERWPYNSTY